MVADNLAGPQRFSR